MSHAGGLPSRSPGQSTANGLPRTPGQPHGPGQPHSGLPPRSPGQSTATCWLCGTQQPTSVMVADGGPSMPDVRWYCGNAQQCTARWSSRPNAAAQPRLALALAAGGEAGPTDGPALPNGDSEHAAQAG
jgi:hypothetical protein